MLVTFFFRLAESCAEGATTGYNDCLNATFEMGRHHGFRRWRSRPTAHQGE